MSRNDDQLKFRVPASLKAALQQVAADNRRSLNAEIIDRLEWSFDAMQVTEAGGVTRPMTADDYRRASAAMVKQASDAARALRRGATLTLTIDAQGHPVSWGEVMQHIAAIRKAGKFKFDALTVELVNADHESSSNREDQEFELMQHYRSLLNAPPTPDEPSS